MMGNGMMRATGLSGLVLAVLVVLLIAAMVKYVFFQ